MRTVTVMYPSRAVVNGWIKVRVTTSAPKLPVESTR